MAPMPFPIGADVVVRTLRNKRGLVIEAGRDGRYRVRVDGVTLACREEDLAGPPAAKKGKRKKGPASPKQPRDERCDGGSSSAKREPTARPGRVDLHGLLVDDGVARLLDEIDRALQRGADRVEVLHGKGSGRMRDAVHRQLASLPVVAAFRLDPDNPGVTWVYF
jgi:DNA mismatch repair protein MutS2